MSNSSVSIVIPVFNRAHLVHRAIDSALAQTHPCEVLVVDHGSTDDIGSVIKGYGERIRYIRRETDSGPIAAWRDGVEQATGEYLHFTYDDDWIDPDFISKCLVNFNDDVGFVYTRAMIVDTRLDSKSQSLQHPRGRHRMDFLAKHILTTNFTISPGCAVFRTKDVLKNLMPEVPGADGIYGANTGVGEDALLFLLATLDYKFYVHVPHYLAFFFAHEGSITTDAIHNGKHDSLRDSYARAKNYYLGLDGAISSPKGIFRFLHKIIWHSASILRI